MSPNSTVPATPLSSGSQSFDLASASEAEYRRLKRRGRRVALVIFAAFTAILAVGGYLVGDFTGSRIWYFVGIVAAIAAGTALSALRPPRYFLRIARLTIAPDRTWFTAADGKEYPLDFDTPKGVFVVEEPATQPLGSSIRGGSDDSARYRLFTRGPGLVTVTRESMEALKTEFARRGLRQSAGSNARKPRGRTVITMYRTPEPPPQSG